MKKYAFLALSVLEPSALSTEDGQRSISVYPESAEDLPICQHKSLNIYRSTDSFDEISINDIGSSNENQATSSLNVHLDTQENSFQDPATSSSDSMSPSSQTKDFRIPSDISLLSTMSSDSPHSSQDSLFTGTSENGTLSSDPALRLHSSSDSASEKDTAISQQTTIVPCSNSQEVPVRKRKVSRIHRVDPSSDSHQVPYVEEPSENTSSTHAPLYPISRQNDAIDMQIFQQIQTFLNPLLLERRMAQPVVLVFNTNPPAPQPVPQEPVVQKTQEVSSNNNKTSIVSENHKDTLEWINLGQGPLSAQRVEITTGSLLSFGGKGTISNAIRRFTKDPNHLGLSHVGMAIVASANEALGLIQQSEQRGGLHFAKSKDQIQKMTHTIQRIFHKKMDKPDVFCIHSTGEMGVHIVPLQDLIDTYEGSIFVRKLKEAISLQELEQFLIRDIGKEYNFSINQLARCTLDSNKTEQNNKTFCSQLVANLYRDVGVLPQALQANNVTPAEFGSHAPGDLLRELADDEKVLKLFIAYDGGCCGCC